MSLSRDSAPVRSNTVSKKRLGSAMRQITAPAADDGGLLKRQEFAQWGQVDKQPAVELGHALVGELDAETRRRHDLDRLAELGDDGVLAIANDEET